MAYFRSKILGTHGHSLTQSLALLLHSVAELRVEPGYLKPLLCDYLEMSQGLWAWPSWKSAYCTTQVWWCTIVIPALGRQREEDQTFKVVLGLGCSLYSEFEASLGYMRLYARGRRGGGKGGEEEKEEKEGMEEEGKEEKEGKEEREAEGEKEEKG